MKIIVVLLLAMASVSASAADVPSWRNESESKDLVIQSRAHPGSSLKEFRAVGTINAPAATIFAVLCQPELYPSYMPYVAETHVLARTKDSTLTYERLKLPLISDRDYTVFSQHTASENPVGGIYKIHGQLANDRGPAPKPGVQRVHFYEGGWLLEPLNNNSTRATYSIFTDSGGAMPAFIANTGSKAAIRKLFEAIRKRVLDPKYSGKQN